MKKAKVVKVFESNGDVVTFRYPRYADHEALMVMRNSLVKQKAFIGQRKVTLNEARGHMLSSLRNIKEKTSVVLVVEIDGRVVGKASVSKVPKSRIYKEPKASYHRRVRIAEYWLGIFLASSAQGRGIGKKLMQAVIDEAKNVLKVRRIFLGVFAANHRARSLYHKMGFVQMGRKGKGKKKHHGVFRYGLCMAMSLQ